ncbi:hypothetical protein BH20ACT9_BH20ACT9_12580 [soil metagenome]
MTFGREQFERARFARTAWPFAVPVVTVFLLALITADRGGGPALVAAGVLTAVVIGAVLALPWQRLPAWAFAAPPLLYCLAVAALREATGGPLSGISPALLLPLFWVAFYGNRGHLAAVVVASAATLAAPILLDVPGYPADEWRRVLVWTLITSILGVAVQDLVRQVREAAWTAERKAEALRVSESTLSGVLQAVRTMSYDAGARTSVCDAARSLTGATSAFLMEPDGHGALGSTGTSGGIVSAYATPVEPAVCGSAIAFTSGVAVFTPRVEGDGRVSRRLREATGARSLLFQPVPHGDRTVAVLVLAWARPVAALDDETTRAVGILAAEIGVRIEGADLLSRVTAQAQTDALTGLPNRRAWDDALRAELARAHRHDLPLVVGLLDLDRFKRFNDTHGHQRGDRLLKEATARWRDCLRLSDVLARWGGEEFAVALPDCRIDTARAVCERLRGATPDDQTCSVGLAVWDGEESAESLVARADGALYAAKRAGRDCLVCDAVP